MGLAILVYVGVRDADIWEVAIIAIVLLVVWGHETIRGTALDPDSIVKAIRTRWKRTRRSLLVGVALLAAASVAGLGALSAHRNVVNVEHALYVRVFPFPDRVVWFARHGMPQGSGVEAQAVATPIPSSPLPKVVGINLNDPKWQALRIWFNNKAQSTYAWFLVTHPGYDVTAPFASPALTYNNALGELSFYSPVKNHVLNTVEDAFVPNYVVVIALSVVAVVVALRKRTWRRQEWKLLVVFAAAGLGSMLLSWHGDGQEATRHMVEGDVAVRLAVLLMFLWAVFGRGEPNSEATPWVGSASATRPLMAQVRDTDPVFVPTTT
jgi:hypothetical protein